MGCCGSRRSVPVLPDTALLSGTALFRARPLPVAWSQVKVTGYPLHCRPRPADSGGPQREQQQRPELFGVPDGAAEQTEGCDSPAGSVASVRPSQSPTFDDLPTLVMQEQWPLQDTVSLEALPPPTPYMRGVDLDDDISLEVLDETRPGDSGDIYSVDFARQVPTTPVA